jgi:hypothetical protein
MSNNQTRAVAPNLPPMLVGPVVLEGKHIRLEPLSLAHHAQWCEVGVDESAILLTFAFISPIIPDEGSQTRKGRIS